MTEEKARLLASLPPREQIKLGEVPITPEWQTALLQASEEADHIQQAKVSSEQLLLGLARNQSGTTNSIFQQLNISAEQIRQLSDC